VIKTENKDMSDITLTDEKTDEITLDDIVKILEIKNRLMEKLNSISNK